MTEKHSLGWVAVRVRGELIGLVNVVWDGHLHARIQDLMVASTARHEEVGTDLVQEACKESSKARCEWLHVDFEEAFAAFYMGACGFEASPAGLLNPPRVCPEIVVNRAGFVGGSVSRKLGTIQPLFRAAPRTDPSVRNYRTGLLP